MFNYARISQIRDYAKREEWPLKIPSALKSHYTLPEAAHSLMPRWNPLKLFKRFSVPSTFKPLPFYYSGNMFHSGTRSWEYPWVLDVLRKQPKGTILDVGCGSSEFMFQYLDLGHSIIGLDHIRSHAHPQSELTPEFVAKWEGHINFVDGDGSSIPVKDSSVDYITCLSVLEHIVSPEGPEQHRKVLSEFRRVLRPGGLLIMTCDTFTNPKVAYGGLPGWTENGWDYADDINFLDMQLLDPNQTICTRKEINADEDTFFIQPDMYLNLGYGFGFELFGDFHRMTSIGYVLVK